MRTLLIALRTTAVTLVLTGLLYPFVVAAIGQVFFPGPSNGSMVRADGGRIVGSELLAQPFTQPEYFHPRPSAAGDNGFDATSSSGSNLGPTSKRLLDRVAKEADALSRENPAAEGRIPAELLTASGSGLDPHLSPKAALWQAPRIAAARGVSTERVRNLVTAETEPRTLGFLGEPRVNVLLLNLALDRQFGHAAAKPVKATAR